MPNRSYGGANNSRFPRRQLQIEKDRRMERRHIQKCREDFERLFITEEHRVIPQKQEFMLSLKHEDSCQNSKYINYKQVIVPVAPNSKPCLEPSEPKPVKSTSVLYITPTVVDINRWNACLSKAYYANIQEAQKALEIMRRNIGDANRGYFYLCPFCVKWHISSKQVRSLKGGCQIRGCVIPAARRFWKKGIFDGEKLCRYHAEIRAFEIDKGILKDYLEELGHVRLQRKRLFHKHSGAVRSRATEKWYRTRFGQSEGNRRRSRKATGQGIYSDGALSWGSIYPAYKSITFLPSKYADGEHLHYGENLQN